jgi:hypothetical protein
MESLSLLGHRQLYELTIFERSLHIIFTVVIKVQTEPISSLLLGRWKLIRRKVGILWMTNGRRQIRCGHLSCHHAIFQLLLC